RLRSALLVGQVALTVTLIGGAGLFVRSVRNVPGQDFGFDPTHTLLATMDLRAAGYRPVEINQLNLQMLARLQVLPGVEAAAATIGHPFGWATGCSVSVPGRDSIPQLKAGGPYCQRVTPGYFAAMGTPVRARGRPQDLVAPVRAAMQQTAANLPYAAVTPLADLVAPSIRPWRLGTTMFGLFAGLALVLAAVGLYSVLSYTVGQRSHEIGIRMAMGARRSNVLGLMVGQGVKIAALGAGIGAVAALAGGRGRSGSSRAN